MQLPLMFLIWFSPESPWWLIRRGRKDEALKSIKRLARRNGNQATADETLAMMERTVKIEAHKGGDPKLTDLVKGTDLRRTIITCLVYASQNFAGNLIANQATFFFERKHSNSGNLTIRSLTICRGWNVDRLLLQT
jgi:SP family general alpha glucoside:H+ symporter-like MFS transporter